MEGIEFSADDLYLFVFRDSIIDIYQSDVIVQSLVTPWAEADLFELDYSHALDTIVVVHGDYSPRRIYRDSSDVFHIEDLMDDTNEIHLTSIPLTLANVFEYRPSTFYAQDWHMVPTTEMPEADYVYEVIRQGTTGITSSPALTKTVGGVTVNTSDDTGAKFKNVGLRTLYYAWTAALGYPRTVTFVENRMVFGGTPTYPNRFWLSRSGDHFNFSLGFAGLGDAIDSEILSDQHEKIQWVFGGRNLVIGTSSGEWANIQNEPITPQSLYLRRQTGIGSARRTPVEIDGSVVHITRERNELQALLYTRAENAYVHDPITLLNPDAITASNQLAVTTSRSADDANLLWALNDDGEIAVLNTLRSQEVLAWCRRSFFDTVEGVATLEDDVYFIVGNNFGVGVYEAGVYESGVYAETGVGSRALVKLSTAKTDVSATSTESPASVTHSGFTHLAGATVQVVADGSFVGTKVVSSGGVITLDAAAEVVVAGMAIPTPTMVTLAPAFDGTRGNISHLKKRIIRALVEVFQTQALTVDSQVQNFRLAQSPVNLPPPSTTGIKEVRMVGWERQPTVTITAPDPMPATVLSMTVEVGY
jgi:hypothetical protein